MPTKWLKGFPKDKDSKCSVHAVQVSCAEDTVGHCKASV